MNKFIITSPIELSEVDDEKPYIELTTRLCYLDYLNLNGVGLSSSATESVETLKDMPIVAKINKKGNKFGSHEVRKGSNGDITFGTNAYGTHTEVWVEDDEVDIPNIGVKTVPCLFAKSKVWKRFSNVVDLIVKKMTDPDNYNGGLYSSWELQGGNFHSIPGGKIYDDFIFLSNCLIDVPPAYGQNSKTLSVASMSSLEEFDTELSEALSQDILALSKEDGVLNINSQEGGKEMSKQKEQSALSMVALEQKLWEKINLKGWSSNPYYSIMNIYPEDHKVLCRDWDKTDEELMVFTYSVDENDEVSIGEGVETKLSKVLAEKSNVNIQVNLDDTAKLLSEREIKIKELDGEISTIKENLSKTEKELAEAGIAISDLTKEKGNLEAQVSELTPFKEKVQEMEQAELDRQLAEKKEELKKFALEDNLIEEAELGSDENLVAIFSELTFDNIEVSQEKIELIKGRKALQKYKEGKDSSQEKELETSTLNIEAQNPKSNLNSDSEGMLTAQDVVKMMLGKK